jgi:hypothetical protein
MQTEGQLSPLREKRSRALDKLAGWPNSSGQLVSFDPLGALMILDNLFNLLGGTGTALVMFGILAFVGAPAFTAVACPTHPLRRVQPRGR